MEILGQAIKDFARRDEVVIVTKVYGRMRPGPNGGGLSRKAMMVEIDASLRRLGTVTSISIRSTAGTMAHRSRRRLKRCKEVRRGWRIHNIQPDPRSGIPNTTP